MAKAPAELDELARQAIIDRLKNPAGVCFKGEPCAENVITTVTDNSGPRTGESIYKQVCQACHNTGVAGAPKKDDKALWAKRLNERGNYQKLLENAINGYALMPPRGGCGDCSDEEISLAIQYMSGLKP